MNKLNYLVVVLLLTLLGCQKDKLTPVLNDDSNEIQTGVQFRSDENFIRDADLVRNFYRDLSEVELRTGFYNSFYHEVGYFSWVESLEYAVAESGKVLVVPVKQSPAGLTNGVFFYYDNGTDQRIQYVDRWELERKISEGQIEELTNDEVFAYQNFLLNDLRVIERGSARELPSYNSQVFARGGDDDDGGTTAAGDPPCEGGSYQYVCIFFQSSGSVSDVDIGGYFSDNYGNNNFQNNPWVRNTYDIYSVDALQAILDALNNGVSHDNPSIGIPSSQISAFTAYAEARIDLFNTTGVGNGPTGILFATLINQTSECQFVWVDCWQDPADFNVHIDGNSGGGGSGNVDPEPWKDDYDELRFCEGVDDLFDVGPDNVDMIHPNFEFCSGWIDYLEDCIIPSLPSNYGQPGGPTYEGVIEEWAMLKEFEPELFANVISDPSDCTPTSDLDDLLQGHNQDLECAEALSSFEATYGLELNIRERDRLQRAFAEDGNAPGCGDQEGFDHWMAMELAKGCTDPFYVLFDQLGITDNEDLLSFCYGVEDTDAPGCEDCSQEETNSVVTDHIRAFVWLHCAVNNLNAYDGDANSDVGVALATHFGGTTSEGVASWLSFLIRHIQLYAIETDYKANNLGEEGCVSPSTAAFIDLNDPGFNVGLCRPKYWSQSDAVRSGYLIHEWTHLYLSTVDIAYFWQDDYAELSTLQSLVNADSFSEFIKQICDE